MRNSITLKFLVPTALSLMLRKPTKTKAPVGTSACLVPTEHYAVSVSPKDADEVRKLAERTTKATKEIAVMIKKIQADTKGAVHSMEQGTLQVDEGIELADKAGSSLLEIVGISQKVTDMVTQIAAASEEQSSASEQISKNVEAINRVTNESATATKQIASAAEDLSRLTENLQQLITRFKLSGDGQSVLRPALREGLKFSRKTATPKSNLAVHENGALVSQKWHD